MSYAQYRHSIISPVKGSGMGFQVCFETDIINALKAANSKINLIAYSSLLDRGLEEKGLLPLAYISNENTESV